MPSRRRAARYWYSRCKRVIGDWWSFSKAVKLLFRAEAEQRGNLTERHVGSWEQMRRDAGARLFHQGGAVGPLVRKSPVERMPVHPTDGSG